MVYCRVSTDEQAREGYSLDAQEKLCRQFCNNNNYRVLGVFRDEGKSATNINRQALQDMLVKCQEEKESINAVIVQETDRLARNTKDHLTIRAILKKAGIKLISVNQPMLDDSPEGNMIDTILASVNQFSSDLSGRKTKKGLQEKFNSGWWPGWAPLGYKNVKLGEKRKIVVPDRAKWNLLKEGFKLYLTGNYSVSKIIDILDKKGLKSKNGKKIPHSIMTNTLNNCFYAGLMRWNGQEKMGRHKAIITLEEHKQILSIMDIHNQHACRRRKYDFLLRGFAFCGICERRLTAEKHRIGKNPDYYHCSAGKNIHSNKGQNIEVKDLERQVEKKFKNLQFSEDFIKLVVEKVKFFYEQKKKEDNIQKRILFNRKIKIEQKRSIAEEKLIAGTLKDEDFVRIRDSFRKELDNIQEEIEKIENRHDIDMDTVREALSLSKNIYRAYKKAPYEIKRLYLSFFWDRFLIKDKKIIKAVPTDFIKYLHKEKKIIISSNWRRGWDSNPRVCEDAGFQNRWNKPLSDPSNKYFILSLPFPVFKKFSSLIASFLSKNAS